MSTRAAVYLRISQDPNADGLAVDRQRGDCLRLAEDRGWTVTEVYSDTMSASKRNAKRPSYDRMVADFAAGKFEALICYDLDRLTRQPRQLEDWIDAAEDTGLVIVTASGEADLSTDNGRLFARIKASVARAEIERKGARQKAKNIQAVASGVPVAGRRRYGYLSNNVTPFEPEAAIVREVFEKVATGTPLYSLSQRFNAQGVPLRHTFTSGGEPVPVLDPWQPRRIREIIQHQSYAGMVKHQGVYTPSNVITPLVDPDLAATARAILADPARRSSPGNTVSHLLSGLVFCALCDRPMFFSRSYKCGTTGHAQIKGETLENHVVELLYLAVMTSPDAGGDGDSTRLKELVAEGAKIAGNRTKLQEMALWDGVDVGQIRSKLAALGRQSAEVEEKIAAERGLVAQGGVIADIRRGFWNAARTGKSTVENQAEWRTYFAGLDLDTQRELVRSSIRVTVAKGRGTDRVRYELPGVKTLVVR